MEDSRYTGIRCVDGTTSKITSFWLQYLGKGDDTVAHQLHTVRSLTTVGTCMYTEITFSPLGTWRNEPTNLTQLSLD